MFKSFVKTLGSTRNLQKKLDILSLGEVQGISSGEVKFVDIGKNTNSEGIVLDHY